MDSPDSAADAAPSADLMVTSRFPAAKLSAAVATLAIGGFLMLFAMFIAGMSHSLNSRDHEPWWWAGILFQLFAGWLFLGVASDASDMPKIQRPWFVLPTIIGSYVLAVAIVLFDAWAVAPLSGMLR